VGWLTAFVPLAAVLLAVAAYRPGLPDQGICAHRGARETHPENTLVALRQAVTLGAHMVEFDVRLTADGQLAVIHDATVSRTTDGTGRVDELRLDQLRALDAGSWLDPAFAGERIPTLHEALAVLPRDVWLNVNLKGGGAALGARAATVLAEENRLDHAMLACKREAAAAAREAQPSVLICNLERTDSPHRYVAETLSHGDAWIQLKSRSVPHLQELVPRLVGAGVRINYCCTDSPDTLRRLFDAGVHFVLADRLASSLAVAAGLGMEPRR